MGLFASPNRAGIMNSLPADQRGVGAGMSATFQNSAMVLSIGIFFSLIILGLSSSLPSHLFAGLTAQGVPAADASRLAHLPPTAVMFAALLGYNPIQMLLGAALTKLPAANAAYLTGHSFFPSLISGPVPGRPGHRVRLLDRGLPDRGRRLAAARQAVRARSCTASPPSPPAPPWTPRAFSSRRRRPPPRCGSRSRKT